MVFVMPSFILEGGFSCLGHPCYCREAHGRPMPLCLDALELEVVDMALVKCVQDVQRGVSFEKLLTVTIKNMSNFY